MDRYLYCYSLDIFPNHKHIFNYVNIVNIFLSICYNKGDHLGKFVL